MELQLRPWEEYWSKNMKNKKNFLRNDGQLSHPSRVLISEYASKFDTVLECGCATAIDYPFHMNHGTKYTGIDITENFIISSKEHNPGIDTRVASMLDLPFKDCSYDTVYCRAVLEHIHPLEWPLGVKEMWRVCDKQMILGIFNWRSNRSKPITFGKREKPEQTRSILERMMKEETEVGTSLGGVYNNGICEPDIIDVIKWVGGESWEKKEVGGPITVKINGQTVKKRSLWKKYHIYIVKKE